jgi:hypothetical protein
MLGTRSIRYRVTRRRSVRNGTVRRRQVRATVTMKVRQVQFANPRTTEDE